MTRLFAATIPTLGALLLQLAVSSAAHATTAQDLDHLRVPSDCVVEMLGADYIVDARDKGATKDQIIEINKKLPSESAMPQSLIDDIFAFPKVGKYAIQTYERLACQARSYGVNVLPLAPFAEELQACFADGFNEPCVRSVRNALLGLPRDYVPDGPRPPVYVAPAKR